MPEFFLEILVRADRYAYLLWSARTCATNGADVRNGRRGQLIFTPHATTCLCNIHNNHLHLLHRLPHIHGYTGSKKRMLRL